MKKVPRNIQRKIPSFRVFQNPAKREYHCTNHVWCHKSCLLLSPMIISIKHFWGKLVNFVQTLWLKKFYKGTCSLFHKLRKYHEEISSFHYWLRLHSESLFHINYHDHHDLVCVTSVAVWNLYFCCENLPAIFSITTTGMKMKIGHQMWPSEALSHDPLCTGPLRF